MPDQDVQAVLRSQEYYRLKQAVQSPGDIYEINESAKAIYIGPDSDIAEVSVTYFNPDEPLSLETAVVSVNGPFVGRIDSLPQTTVPSTGQPARITVSPVDFVDNSYIPPGTQTARQFNVPAIIDLIVALKQLPDIPGVRADRTLRFPKVPYSSHITPPPAPPFNNGSTDLIIPIYGRRLCSISIIGNDVTAQFQLVTLTPGGLAFGRSIGRIIIGATIPPTPFELAAVIRASDAARSSVSFDAAGAAITGYSNESDQPDELVIGTNSPNPKPRGVADLLVVNLTDTAGSAGPFTKFVDVFVKVSDRET